MHIEKNISLKNKNTYRIGGLAAFYTEPENEDEIIESAFWASQKKLPIFILGNGSNLLISDNGWPGLVINVSETFCEISWDHETAIAQCGAMLNMLVNQSIDRSLTGLEELCGIPGTIGGAVIMNAGAFSMCVENVVEWVRYFDIATGKIITCSKAAMQFGYRTSLLKDKQVIVLTTGFVFNHSKTHEELVSIRSTTLSKRKEKQPLEYPNCGSVFKRPMNNYAGTLIEKCGLKGMRIGGAEVSVKHANFIINRDNGTSEDVRSLIALVQKTVYEREKILLEPEVIFMGSFTNELFTPQTVVKG
jgi:UDP-N-acetylmuramate dehydrogenase